VFMEPELKTLAGSAATVLVGAMREPGWPARKTAWARLVGRGNAKAEANAAEALDEDAASLTPASEADTVTGWKIRLQDLLRAHPEAAVDLRTLLAPAAGAGVRAGRVGQD
jgi:hypothetical protein